MSIAGRADSSCGLLNRNLSARSFRHYNSRPMSFTRLRTSKESIIPPLQNNMSFNQNITMNVTVINYIYGVYLIYESFQLSVLRLFTSCKQNRPWNQDVSDVRRKAWVTSGEVKAEQARRPNPWCWWWYTDYTNYMFLDLRCCTKICAHSYTVVRNTAVLRCTISWLPSRRLAITTMRTVLP